MNRRGFTLLEILIATGIFMIVMVVGVGIFTINVGSSSLTDQLRINSQSARFAFESITREVRLAHGLVYIDNSDAKMVVPPFEVVPDVANQGKQIIRIYQVKALADTDSQGKTKYSVKRQIYSLAPTTSRLQLQSQSAYTSAGKTAEQLYKIVTTMSTPNLMDGLDGSFSGGLDWDQLSTAEAILPKQLAAEQFNIIRSYNYPASGQSLASNSLVIQPFMQIDLTVVNPQYNANRDDNRRIKTTLRTTIVPRNFLSPYEVSQTGVQGAVK